MQRFVHGCEAPSSIFALHTDAFDLLGGERRRRLESFWAEIQSLAVNVGLSS